MPVLIWENYMKYALIMAMKDVELARAVRSLQRLVIYLIITLILTLGTLYVFHQFIAAPISLPTLFDQAIRIIIIVGFWAAAILIIRHFKPLMSERMGNQAATIVQYVMLTIAILLMMFGILNVLQVSATELLAGAGIISITAGLVISTFVGSILSGFLVFANYQFKVGDDVIVNGIPGSIIEMSALVMRIQTDVGHVTIPNSAIASGGVIITVVHKYENFKPFRLHYLEGDRVMTSFMNEQGTVKQITPLNTVIQLDSGKEVTFLNNSILSGTVVIAKITQALSETKAKTA
jgi:small-conductance mechanosensitive channel